MLMHPFVLGELASGILKDRAMVLKLLGDLPAAPSLSNQEALAFIETDSSWGGKSAGLIFTCLLRLYWRIPQSYGQEIGGWRRLRVSCGWSTLNRVLKNQSPRTQYPVINNHEIKERVEGGNGVRLYGI